MNSASLTGAEIASRVPVSSADAIAASIARQCRADARVDDGAHLGDHRRVAHPRGRRHRRLGDPDRAGDEAGRADALEIKVAREIVAAGPQGAQRRIEPRRHLHERADGRRRPFLDRQAHALGRIAQPALDRVHAHHDAVGALALLAHLDEARERDVPRAVLQDRVRDAGGLHRDDRKARGRRRCADEQRERDRAGAGDVCDDGEDTRERQPGPERRLMLGREVDDDPDPETDRQPWEQSPGRRVGCEPALKRLARAADEARVGKPRDAARTRNVPGPNASPALRHRHACN